MKIINKDYFSSYFTGLFEASGGIYIPKGKYPKITIFFNKANKALAEAIKERIGYGNIYEKRTGLSYEIFNREGILKFIKITQKYLRTPKIYEYNNMIEYLNISKKQKISLAELNTNSFSSDAWLSGFLESNGCFYIKPVARQGSIKSFLENNVHTYSYDYQLMFELGHKKEDKNNYSFAPFLESLAVFFGTTLYDNLCMGNYTISLDNIEKVWRLLDYLYRFPLFGVQYMNYEALNEVFYLQHRIVSRRRIKERKERVLALKESMNKEILDYKAEHLELMPKYNYNTCKGVPHIKTD